ncbi:MAG: ATP synthase subunit I [Proteobacteria bacterium]|nr:ATP synthase subunit I [Pseudomonadota bacterium]
MLVYFRALTGLPGSEANVAYVLSKMLELLQSSSMIPAAQIPKRVLIAQALLVAVTTCIFAVVSGQPDALAALYGGAITLVGSWWLSRRIRHASDLAKDNPGAGAIALYGGAIERFVYVTVAFAIGLGVLKLSVLPLMMAFIVAYLGFLVVVLNR